MTSNLELKWGAYWRMLGDGTDYTPEYRWAALASGGTGKGLRKRLQVAGLHDWRFDCAWVEQQIAVELEGGTYTRGRHTRGAGYSSDCAKYNAAQLHGWIVLRFTADMLHDDSARCIEQVKRALTIRRQYAARAA